MHCAIIKAPASPGNDRGLELMTWGSPPVAAVFSFRKTLPNACWNSGKNFWKIEHMESNYSKYSCTIVNFDLFMDLQLDCKSVISMLRPHRIIINGMLKVSSEDHDSTKCFGYPTGVCCAISRNSSTVLLACERSASCSSAKPSVESKWQWDGWT